jgi:hypothetical protein
VNYVNNILRPNFEVSKKIKTIVCSEQPTQRDIYVCSEQPTQRDIYVCSEQPTQRDIYVRTLLTNF